MGIKNPSGEPIYWVNEIIRENKELLSELGRNIYKKFPKLLEQAQSIVKEEGITLKLTQNYPENEGNHQFEIFYTMRDDGIYQFKIDLSPASMDQDYSTEIKILNKRFLNWINKDVTRLIDATRHIDDYVRETVPAIRKARPLLHEYSTTGIKYP